MAEPKLRRFKITFHSKDGDSSDVVIGHNYVLNQYKRNVETIIDENYLDVLKHAVVHTVVNGEDGKPYAISIPQHAYTVGEEVK